MQFEFDAAKSAANRDKHGIDFVTAQGLWNDAFLLVAPLPFEGEARLVAIGRLGGRHWTAVWTPRGGRVRLISVRRSRAAEREIYERARDQDR